MRVVVVFFCLMFLTTVVYADAEYLNKKYSHTDEYATIIIHNDSLELDTGNVPGTFVKKKYFNMFEGEEYHYIILDCKLAQSEFLTLIKKYSSSKFRYSRWETTYDNIVSIHEYNASKLLPFTVIKADSFITEKDKDGNEIRFLPEENDFFSLSSNPWAVKKDDKKVIYLSTERWRHPTTVFYPISDIVFVNGFVYPDKDYLYEQNSRAKRIRISYDETSFEVELKDTGNYQVVHLPAKIDPRAKNNIKLEILDYYPGTRYSDIVISGVYYMEARVN